MPGAVLAFYAVATVLPFCAGDQLLRSISERSCGQRLTLLGKVEAQQQNDLPTTPPDRKGTIMKRSIQVKVTDILLDAPAALPDRSVPILDALTEDDLWDMQEIAEMEVSARMGKRQHFDDYRYTER